MSAIGWTICTLLVILGRVPKRHGNALYFEIGDAWGGVNLGPVFVVNRNASEHIRDHELGHGYQNCILGPLFLIICAWSVARYHYRKLLVKLTPQKVLTPYDSIWFENWATRLGRTAMGRDLP